MVKTSVSLDPRLRDTNGLIALDAFLAQLNDEAKDDALSLMRAAAQEFTAQGVALSQLQLVMELDQITEDEDKALRLTMYVQAQNNQTN